MSVTEPLTSAEIRSGLNFTRVSNDESEIMNLPPMSFDAEMNAQFANEKSRTVKLCMLKHRCILMFTFMLLSFLQFCYIMFKEVLFSEDKVKSKLIELLELISVARNVTK